jgi:hypothetical protein
MIRRAMKTKRFPLSAVLSIAADRLLCPMDEMYGILSHLAGESVYTHQMGRFMREAQPWLMRWFPELKLCCSATAKLDAMLEDAADADRPRIVREWIAGLPASFPQVRLSYDVPPIPADDHERKDALAELVEMVGPDRVIAVQAGEKEG